MFNPQARWDRSLPGEQGADAEIVEVIARFRKGRIVPLYFFRGENRFDIQRIHYSWSQRKGSNRIIYFNVSDKNDNYCLFLDAEMMSWRLRIE